MPPLPNNSFDPWRVASVLGYIIAGLFIVGMTAYTVANALLEYFFSRGI